MLPVYFVMSYSSRSPLSDYRPYRSLYVYPVTHFIIWHLFCPEDFHYPLPTQNSTGFSMVYKPTLHTIVFISVSLMFMFIEFVVNSFFIMRNTRLACAILQLIPMVPFPPSAVSFQLVHKTIHVIEIDFVYDCINVWLSSLYFLLCVCCRPKNITSVHWHSICLNSYRMIISQIF